MRERVGLLYPKCALDLLCVWGSQLSSVPDCPSLSFVILCSSTLYAVSLFSLFVFRGHEPYKSRYTPQRMKDDINTQKEKDSSSGLCTQNRVVNEDDLHVGVFFSSFFFEWSLGMSKGVKVVTRAKKITRVKGLDWAFVIPEHGFRVSRKG